MLSKPKMPTPYNTVVDVDVNKTYGCVLTEGNVGRYEITVSDLYGNEVGTAENEAQGNSYWAAGNKISSVVAGNDKLRNFNEYKWKIRLFEQKDSVSTWCSYGVLQNVQDSDTDEVADSPVVNSTNGGVSVTLQVSAHQNISIDTSSGNNANTFTRYGIDYLANGVNYSPNPLTYNKNNDGKYQLLLLTDVTNNININAVSLEADELDFSNGNIASYGILEDIVPTTDGNNKCLFTVYDQSGNILVCSTQYLKYNSGKGYVYDDNGNKLPIEKRMFKYTLKKNVNGDLIIYISTQSSSKPYASANLALLEWDSGNNVFEDGTALDTNAIIISERDYKLKKESTQNITRTYHFKIGGETYLVTNYVLKEPNTESDMDIYTYGEITIQRQDGTAIDTSIFKTSMQYTIYTNFIDSDEYYFKTFPNLFVNIAIDDTILSSTLYEINTIEETLYGKLTDINGNLYSNKICSYQWYVSLRTLNGYEIIYDSGLVSGSVPTLTYKNFVENQEYIISLKVITDDNIIYTSEDCVIRSVSFDYTTEIDISWSNPCTMSAVFNNEKKCVDVLLTNGLNGAVESLVSNLNYAQGVINPQYKCSFDRIDVYKTENGCIYNKVASVPPDILSSEVFAELLSISEVSNTSNETTISKYNGHVEDHLVGAGNTYTYYLYPVLKFDYFTYEDNIRLNDSVKYRYLAPMISNEITIPAYGIAVIGLMPNASEYGNIIKDSYVIDYENIWHFTLNIQNDSTMLNMAHTLHEGQGKYGKMSIGQRCYVSGGVSALFGDHVCNLDKYEDGMSYLENWEQFINNGELKIVCDQYGRVLPVDINECSYSYQDKSNIRLTSVNFKYTQLANINNIEVIFNNEYFNLTDSTILGNNLTQILSTVDESETSALAAMR